MSIRLVPFRAAASCAAAFFFLSSGCATTQSAPEQVLGVKPDPVDQGGQMQTPVSGCSDEGVLYRYVARTFGGQARIDEFCMSPEGERVFTQAPPQSMEGACPAELCGLASTWRRGPIEHALLQSIVSLERSRATRLEMMRSSMKEEDERYEVDVSKGTTRFRLSSGVECIANLVTYKEETGAGTQPGDEVISPEDLSFFYTSDNTISRGSIWVEQRRNGVVHDLMVIVENAYEDHDEAELFKETILCKSTDGAISSAGSELYDFRVNRASIDEWGVHAFRR